MSDPRMRITIRITDESMSFSVAAPQAKEKMVIEPYEMNTGISAAANLRETFNTSELLRSGYAKALVTVDTPVLLVPLEEWREEEAETLYRHTFANVANTETIVSSIVPDLNAVAAHTVSKDLRTVIDDHFAEARYMPIGMPVWQHLFHRSTTGNGQKLYAHFLGNHMEVFCFQHNRFRFFNTFRAEHAHDALYYLLYTWKQLAFDTERDGLWIAGSANHEEWLTDNLKRYLHNVHTITPVSGNAALPYDLTALYA